MFASIRLSLATLLALAPAAAMAKVKIDVDLDKQTIHVEAKGQTYDWKVSSGKPGYETPAGNFKVLWMDKDHHSDTYEQAYMPNAIFFAPGYAIHGFGKSPWGHKASHGCIRIPMAKSELLFSLVKSEGAEINITGASPVKAPTVAEVEAKRRAKEAASAADADSVAASEYGADGQAYDAGPAPGPATDDGGYDTGQVVSPRTRDGFFGSVY